MSKSKYPNDQNVSGFEFLSLKFVSNFDTSVRGGRIRIRYSAFPSSPARSGLFTLFGSLLLLTTLAGCKAKRPAIPTPQMDTEPQFQVRALLLNNITSCTFKTTSLCTVSYEDSAIKNLKFEISNFESGTSIQLTTGRITIGNLLFASNQVTILPDNPHIFNLNGDNYRGKLKLILSPDCNSFDAVNIVPMEPYLAGVVGAEMPRYWEPEALKAQAIAARTYCLHIKKRFGSNRNWDVTKTQANQVYLGVSAESAQVWEAVNQTQGQVLVCKQTDGTEDIFPAYYSSTCGGHTENSSNVFGDRFEPLVGVPCPYCRNVAKPTSFFWPTALFDNTFVTAKLSQRYPALTQLGEIIDINSAKQSDYEDFSRLTGVKLLGSTGKSDFLKAEDLRLTIDPTGKKIKSTICRIIKSGDKWEFSSGRGYGHGVGMCQCGAQAMAREGNTAEQILSYYYPGSKILTIRY
jgi:stage II sporulation protein D